MVAQAVEAQQVSSDCLHAFPCGCDQGIGLYM